MGDLGVHIAIKGDKYVGLFCQMAGQSNGEA